MFQTLYSFLLGKYRENEFPALRRQFEVWQRKRPFEGLRILDGTPVFRNTLAKYLPMLAGGAELTVAMSDGIPGDADVFNRLPKFGIRPADGDALRKRYDVVLDCAGKLAQVNSTRGYVELTRSGEAVYRDMKMPVFLADAGQVKAIETGLGTGDGFIRAMKKLGYGDFKNRKIAVFGCGKVGRGIVAGILREGGVPTVIDDPARVTPPHGVGIVDCHDFAAVNTLLAGVWCAVSATGVKNALAGEFDMARLIASDVLVANMGVEDEFGEAMPPERVLNDKKPLNFMLNEPTHLKYIDPTMALSNYGAWKLVNAGETLPCGIIRPTREEEEAIFDSVRKYGAIREEMEEFFK